MGIERKESSMQPIVSVIIPVYNVKPFLCESLDSAIRQTYKNIEIIIVDDGSTDGSSGICDAYEKKDKRIKVIHQKNRGLSAARNAGLDVANGEYIAFLDSDDAFMPDAIMVWVNSIKRSSADIVICGFNSYKTSKRLYRSHHDKSFKVNQELLSSKDALRCIIDGKINVSVWNKLYDRRIFDGLRFPEGYNHEDLIITPYLIERAKKVMCVNKQLVMYRNRTDSISSTVSEKNVFDWIYASKKMEEFVFERMFCVFDNNYMKSLRESIFWGLLGKKLALQSDGKDNTHFVKAILNKEIKCRARYVQDFSLKTQIYYWFFQNAPSLCLRIKCSYRRIKNAYDRLICLMIFR